MGRVPIGTRHKNKIESSTKIKNEGIYYIEYPYLRRQELSTNGNSICQYSTLTQRLYILLLIRKGTVAIGGTAMVAETDVGGEGYGVVGM